MQQEILKTPAQTYKLNIIILLDKVENIVAQWEISHREQFFLLPFLFQNSLAANASINKILRLFVFHNFKQMYGK